MREGRRGEQWLAELFRWAGLSCDIVGKSKTADLAVYGKGLSFRVEVKNDLKYAETGNIAVEYHNPRSGKPSGILVTKSELWCFVFGGPDPSAWLTLSSTLKDYFHNRPFWRDVKSGGDGNTSFKLYRAADLLRIFKRVDSLSPDGIVSLLRELL